MGSAQGTQESKKIFALADRYTYYRVMAEEKVTDGVYQLVTVETFPAIDHDTTLEWQARPYHNRGKIMIGDDVIDDDRLNRQDKEKVPAGQQVRVFEMTVRFA